MTRSSISRAFVNSTIGLGAVAIAVALTVGQACAETASDPFLSSDLPLPVAASPAPVIAAVVPPPASLFASLNIPSTSPRGTNMTSIEPENWYRTGREFADGVSVPKDAAEGAYWLKRAFLSRLGPRELAALSRVGFLYATGEGVAQDVGAARLYWEIGAAGSDPSSLYYLGVINERGVGVDANREHALEWYRRAKALGSKDAATALLRLEKP